MFTLSEKPSYTLQIPPVFSSGKSEGVRISIRSTTITDILKNHFGDGLKDVFLISEGRSIYCKAVTVQGDAFVKVFFSIKNPTKLYALIEKAYSEAGKNYRTTVLKIGMCVYLSIGTWVEGTPLVCFVGSMNAAEQNRAGEEIGKMLKAIHRLRDFKNYGIKRTDFKRQLFGEYLTLKIDREKNSDVWRLYSFVKSHYKLLEGDVLCHGDMHANNVLCDTEKGVYTLIDYDSMTVCSPYIDIAPLMFLPKPFAPFIKSVVAVCFTEKPNTERLAVAAAWYGLTHRKSNGAFVKRANEIIDSVER